MALGTHKIKTLAELKGRTLAELLHEVARSGESITVVLAEGASVTIQPAAQLQPLPALEGRVPDGWKDAIY